MVHQLTVLESQSQVLHASLVRRKQRRSHVPPPEAIEFRRSRTPSHNCQHLSARGRSSTPAPSYEPPPEQFTPLREVIRSNPRVSKSSKRKKTPKAIKKEPLEIDPCSLRPRHLLMTHYCFVVVCDLHGPQSQHMHAKHRNSGARPTNQHRQSNATPSISPFRESRLMWKTRATWSALGPARL